MNTFLDNDYDYGSMAGYPRRIIVARACRSAGLFLFYVWYDVA